MHFTISALAALAVITPALGMPQPATDDNFGNWPCVSQCFVDKSTDDWISGECDGTETTVEAIHGCTCASIKADPFFKCMTGCPKDEQEQYVKDSLTGVCDDLLDGSSGGGKDDKDDKDDKDNKDDKDDDAKPSATGDSEEPSATADSEEDDAEEKDDEEDAAISRSAPALLAAGGLVAAFFL